MSTPILGNRGRAQLAVALHLLGGPLQGHPVLGNRGRAQLVVTLHLLGNVLQCRSTRLKQSHENQPLYRWLDPKKHANIYAEKVLQIHAKIIQKQC